METTQPQSNDTGVLESVPLVRKFIYEKDGEKINLPDFNPLLPPQDIIKFYAGQYPELTNSKVEKPEMEGNDMIFNIGTSVGTKG
jgi:PRTRC genetic system protein C